MPETLPGVRFDPTDYGVITVDAVDEEPAWLREPLPQCCPSRNGIALMPFQIMLPCRYRLRFCFRAVFEITQCLDYDAGLVRFGAEPPRNLVMVNENGSSGPFALVPGDRLMLHYWP